LLRFCVKILFCRHYHSAPHIYKKREGSGSAPLTNGSGSGSPILLQWSLAVVTLVRVRYIAIRQGMTNINLLQGDADSVGLICGDLHWRGLSCRVCEGRQSFRLQRDHAQVGHSQFCGSGSESAWIRIHYWSAAAGSGFTRAKVTHKKEGILSFAGLDVLF
jgi:hypothetical protein